MPTELNGITIVFCLIWVVIWIIQLICYLNLNPTTKFLLTVVLFCLYVFYLFNFWFDYIVQFYHLSLRRQVNFPYMRI
jgi:hypothetical protein